MRHVVLYILVFVYAIFAYTNLAKGEKTQTETTSKNVKDSSLLLKIVLNDQNADAKLIQKYLANSYLLTNYGSYQEYSFDKNGTLRITEKSGKVKVRTFFDSLNKRFIYLCKEDGTPVILKNQKYLAPNPLPQKSEHAINGFDIKNREPKKLSVKEKASEIVSLDNMIVQDVLHSPTPKPCLKKGKWMSAGDLTHILKYGTDPNGLLNGSPEVYRQFIIDRFNLEAQKNGVTFSNGSQLYYTIGNLVWEINNGNVVQEPIGGHIQTWGFSQNGQIIPLDGGRGPYSGETGLVWYQVDGNGNRTGKRIPIVSLSCGNPYVDNWGPSPMVTPPNTTNGEIPSELPTDDGKNYGVVPIRRNYWGKVLGWLGVLALLALLGALLLPYGGGSSPDKYGGGGNNPGGFPPPDGPKKLADILLEIVPSILAE